MRLAYFPEPLQQVGGTMTVPPVGPRSLCILANRKLTFTRANVWWANRPFPLANLVFPPRQVTIPFSPKTLTTSQPYLAITSMITATWLDQISTREKIPDPKGRISMVLGCRMRCSSEAATRCTRGTFRRLPRRMVAFACRKTWQDRFSKTPP